MRDASHRGEELDSLVNFHGQHFADVLAAPRHCQRFRIEALTVADVARYFDIGKEAHRDGAHPLALADRAAAVAGVERETRGRVTPRAGFQSVREQLADGVPHADICCRARARRLADRRLVHFEYTVDGLEPGHLRAPLPAMRNVELHTRRLA